MVPRPALQLTVVPVWKLTWELALQLAERPSLARASQLALQAAQPRVLALMRGEWRGSANRCSWC